MQFHIHRAIFLSAIWFSCFAAQNASADLTINLNYASFNTNAPNTTTIFGGASVANARSVINTAASYWETAFANSNSSRSFATSGNITIDIDVGWAAHGGSTLATAGPSFFPNGSFATSSLDWDSDGSSNFFVDSTPLANEEFTQSSFRSASQGGVSMNAERMYWGADYAGPLDGANGRADMLSVAIHEIGHAIGHVTSYTFYNGGGSGGQADSDPDNDSDIDIVGGPFAGADIAYSGGHLSQTLANPDANGLGFDRVYTNNPAGPFSILPNPAFSTNLGASITTGTRKLASEIDIAVVGSILGFDQSTINFNPMPVPEPSSGGLALLLFGVVVSMRHRRTA